jgi:DNA invertase Pin-like site-specific DNA recombinase
MMIVGYARVSTDGQSLEAQQAALRAAGAERIFAEKISGAVTDRKALAKAIAALGVGDVLLVTRLDRLARSTRDLLNVLDSVSRAGAKFKSLAGAWANTTTPHGELMITILAGLATFERHLIKARTDEGRTRDAGSIFDSALFLLAIGTQREGCRWPGWGIRPSSLMSHPLVRASKSLNG